MLRGTVMDMNSYMPVRLVTGKDCVTAGQKEFSKYGDHCLILTGKKSAKLCGALDDVTKVLDQQGIKWTLCDIIGQNPKLTDCMKAAETAIACGAKFVVGIGGGSPLDAAKCVAVLAANEGMTQEELYAYKWVNQPLPVVAVGTTAGTGSEVTKVAVITTIEGFKKSVKDDSIYPRASFGDFTYTESLSETFTRSTAVDAMAHCVESYFCLMANELSQMYAVRGIQLLVKVFRKLLASGFESVDIQDREILYNASIYGGLAINVTGTAMPHAVGYLLTEQHNVPHGVACAVFLPDFYFKSKETAPNKPDSIIFLFITFDSKIR